MSKQKQNKGYEKPFFQPLNNQKGFWVQFESIQQKINVARKAKNKKN